MKLHKKNLLKKERTGLVWTPCIKSGKEPHHCLCGWANCFESGMLSIVLPDSKKCFLTSFTINVSWSIIFDKAIETLISYFILSSQLTMVKNIPKSFSWMRFKRKHESINKITYYLSVFRISVFKKHFIHTFNSSNQHATRHSAFSIYTD